MRKARPLHRGRVSIAVQQPHYDIGLMFVECQLSNLDGSLEVIAIKFGIDDGLTEDCWCDATGNGKPNPNNPPRRTAEGVDRYRTPSVTIRSSFGISEGLRRGPLTLGAGPCMRLRSLPDSSTHRE